VLIREGKRAAPAIRRRRCREELRRAPSLGRSAFAALPEIHRIESDFEAKAASAFNEMIARAGEVSPALSA